MPVDALVGLQRGDEGKGRFADLITPEYDIVARGNGGANAGHTFHPEGMEPLSTHQLPSGIAHNGKMNVIGAGVFLDPVRLKEEIEDAQKKGYEITSRNLLISDVAQLVLPHHVLLDVQRENGHSAQGSTKSGIAYVASEKYLRQGIRLEDALAMNSENREKFASDRLDEVAQEVMQTESIEEDGALTYYSAVLSNVQDTQRDVHEVRSHEWAKAVNFIQQFVGDTGEFMRDSLKAGRKVLAEGAQAFWLDVDHGMYPYVTSSQTTVHGLLQGLGIAPHHLGNVYGVAKAVKSHVGGGPLVTHVKDEAVEARIRGDQGLPDSEFGATTGRPRSVGYFDLVEINTAVNVNGVNEIFLSKLDHVPRYGSIILMAMGYRYEGNVMKVYAPTGSARQLEDVRDAVYGTNPSWSDSISHIKDFNELPEGAKQFVETSEEFLETPITKIGVGYHRNELIEKPVQEEKPAPLWK